MRYIKDLTTFSTEEIIENTIVNEKYVLLSEVEDILSEIDDELFDITDDMEGNWNFKSALNKVNELRSKL